MSATLRNTGIQSSSAASYTVNWPSGTVAGDMAVIMYGGGFALTSIPTGWSSLYVSNQGNFNGTAIWKILNSTDISTGSVVLTPTGTFNSVVGIVTVQGGTFDATATPLFAGISNPSSASTRTVNGYSPDTNDLCIYFGACRANGAVTCSLGVQQQQITTTASGAIYTENPGSTTPSPVLSYATVGNGDTNFCIVVQVRATIPWLEGTGAQQTGAASVVVPWPAGTVAGDTAVIGVLGVNPTLPSGWTSLFSNSGANFQGRAMYRVLNSTDISTGNVTITSGGGLNSVYFIATLKQAYLVGYSAPVATGQQASSGAGPKTLNYTANGPSDYVLLMGGSRSFSVLTISQGNFREWWTDGTLTTATMTAGSPAGTGTQSPSFNYPGSLGDVEIAVAFQVPPYVPPPPPGGGGGGSGGVGKGKGNHSGSGPPGLFKHDKPKNYTVADADAGASAYRQRIAPLLRRKRLQSFAPGLPLRAKGFAKSSGKAGTSGGIGTFALHGKGAAQSAGRSGTRQLTAFPLRGRGHAKSSGRLSAKGIGFGDWVAAVSSFFWNRPL